MKLIVRPSTLKGEVAIPGSKSHTIRAAAIAALATGQSEIIAPLDSSDARSARQAYQALGASFRETEMGWVVTGFDGQPQVPENVIDVGNSGTTMRMVLGTASLLKQGLVVLTGDDQIRRRPCGPLANSLTELGAKVIATRGNGCPPFVVAGKLRGGHTRVEAVTSQYLSSLLLNAPLAERDTTITVWLLNERPYVEMTLDWIRKQGIRLENEGLHSFHIPGGQIYQPVRRKVPADFSSATFFLCAGALGDNQVTSLGLDMTDTQGDKAVVDYLQTLGAQVTIADEAITVQSAPLQGCELDLNATPDALPMMAVLACFVEGVTTLANVPQARLKETDRIATMTSELVKMGAQITEREDGMVIESSKLTGTTVCGHHDHRVVMALAIAGTQATGVTTIATAEAMSVTFPSFVECVRQLGAEAELVDD